MTLEKTKDKKFSMALNFSPVVQNMSPITNLANSLGNLSTLSCSNDTPKRMFRSDPLDTFILHPVPMLPESDSDSPVDSPMMQERLLKEMKVDNNCNRMKGWKIERRLQQFKRIDKENATANSSSFSEASCDSYDSGYGGRRTEISSHSSYGCDNVFSGMHHSVREDADDGFNNIFDDKFDENSQMPSSYTNLLIKPLVACNTQVDCIMSLINTHESLLLTDQETNTECIENDQTNLPLKQIDNCRRHNTSDFLMTRKRPESKALFSPVTYKRRKSKCLKVTTDVQNLTPSKNQPDTCNIKKSVSLNEAAIMNAVQRAMQEPDLIGDFSKPYALPLTDGKNNDLKNISPDTVAHLLEGQYSEVVNSYAIVDCRYPYEYSAGHIKGAENIYTKDDIYCKLLAGQKTPVESSERNIIVFHCEFSSERGPKLCRYLRNEDREKNRNIYPYLHYPEVYMLNGGYKAFYQNHKELCEPPHYKPMLHKDHEKELRQFRAKSKSSGDEKRSTARSGLIF